MTGKAPWNIIQNNGKTGIAVAGVWMQLLSDQFRPESQRTVIFPVSEIQLGKDADGGGITHIEFCFFHAPIQVHACFFLYGIKAGDHSMTSKQADRREMIGEHDFLFIGPLFIGKIRIEEIIRNLSQPDPLHVVGTKHRVTTPEGIQFPQGCDF